MSGKFGIFNPFDKWKKGDLPFAPTVMIALNRCGIKNGVVKISGTLVSESEIDFTIDELKKDLESVRKEAKKSLKKQRNKMQSLK